MTSRTHDVGAVAMLLTMVVYYTPQPITIPTILVAMTTNIIGALLPDIDQASNRLWDLIPGGNFLGKILKKLFLSHRTLSHSLLGLFLFYKLNIWLIPKVFNANFIDPKIMIWALMIGFVSHLLLDLMTIEGIPLLFPIKWKFGFPPMKWLRVKTDHWVEKWIIFPLITGYILWLVGTSWQKLIALVKMGS